VKLQPGHSLYSREEAAGEAERRHVRSLQVAFSLVAQRLRRSRSRAIVPRMNAPIASPGKARPLAPVALLLTLAAIVHALIVGCGGSQESGNQANTSSSSTTAAAPSTQPAPDTGAVAADPVAAGKLVYQARCVLCHGPEGKGDGPAAAALNPKPRNHTDGAYMNSRTDEELLAVIHNGKGGMPAWKSVLSEQEMQNVLKYVRTLAK